MIIGLISVYSYTYIRVLRLGDFLRNFFSKILISRDSDTFYLFTCYLIAFQLTN